MTTATKRKKITKGSFLDALMSRYDGKVQARVNHENQYDGKPPVKMTLYYEILDTPDKHGLTQRHCGTWMDGEGWEFLPENGKVTAPKELMRGESLGENEPQGSGTMTEEEAEADACRMYIADHPIDPTNPVMNGVDDIRAAIRAGELDDHLDGISDAVHDRRKSVRAKRASDMKSSLSVGDKVVIARISPKYLVGAIATVVELPSRGKKVLVRLEETRRSWPMGTEAKVAASCLDPHDGGPTDSDLNPIPREYRSWKSYNYFIRIETVGNPDRNQYAPVTDPISLHSQSWDGLCDKIQEHINFYGIGGGNWTNPVLIREGKPVGIVSYNLRVWDTTDAFDLIDAKEILPTVNGI